MIDKTPEIHESKPNMSENPWDELKTVPFTEIVIPESLPTTSPNHSCNFYLREINQLNRFETVKDFLHVVSERAYYRFDSENEFNQFQTEYSTNLNSHLNAEDKATLKQYTGLDYKVINQISRGYWDYNTLGVKTPEKVASAEQTISQISQIIQSAPPIDFDFATYRGTNLSSFRGYNINSISDLRNLQSQFFLDEGFCSSSFTPEANFFNREFDDPLRQTCNINIEYLIPKDCHEGIGLLSDDVSYSPNQHEFLINRDNLSYISQVKIDEDQESAHLQMILIPREIYDHP